MRTLIIITSVFTLSLTMDVTAQCGFDYEELLNTYCTGIYLMHNEIDTMPSKISITLKEGSTYAFYFLNPTQKLKDILFTDTQENTIELQSLQELGNNQFLYVIKPKKSEVYKFTLDMENENDGCVLWALYLQNDFRPGIYRNFDELRFNNPSIALENEVKVKTTKYGKHLIESYTIELEKTEAKSIGNVFGFSDGNYIYLSENRSKLRPSTRFMKLESIGTYYYYEQIEYIPVYTGTAMVTTTVLYKRLMDNNTGEIILLNKKNLIEIIDDNENLLNEFLDESKKEQKLKEYLVKYYEEKENS